MKKLIVFLLFAFIPMIAVGVFLHFHALPTEPGSIDGVALMSILMTAGSMLIPFLAVIFTQLIFKEPVLRGVGISFKFNRWWWIGWLLMPVLAMVIMGVSLLMPGAQWIGGSDLMVNSAKGMPQDFGPWGVIAISLASGLFAGATINAVFAFGEEVAWRGFLVKEFKGRKFLATALWTGVIWGFWHAPIILNGHNYPQHPVIGVFMMVVLCVAMTPMLLYFREKSGSVIVPAIMHGTINAVVGVSNLYIHGSDLLIGGPGLAGILVFLLADTCLFLYDKFVTKEGLFLKEI